VQVAAAKKKSMREGCKRGRPLTQGVIRTLAIRCAEKGEFSEGPYGGVARGGDEEYRNIGKKIERLRKINIYKEEAGKETEMKMVLLKW